VGVHRAPEDVNENPSDEVSRRPPGRAAV